MIKLYEKYKESGLVWIAEIPSGWELGKLKFNASLAISTVDRHELEDEISVSVCHYPQAYYNEKINKNTGLSSGTCNVKELENFKLKTGQIIITKDSETSDDIGIPTFVEEDIPNAVCGYHLAMITANEKFIHSAFLFRYLQSKNVNYYFDTKSNGVTRFGLGKPAMENLPIPIPSIEEQIKIAQYLDQQTAIIDQLILQKEKLIELLKEKKQAVINETVTKGLNPKAKMKDSGIEWLGEMPEVWSIKRLRYLGKCQNGVSQGSEYFGSGDPFVSYGDVYKNMTLPIEVNGLANSTDSDKEAYSVLEGDVFFTRTSETIEEIGFASTCLQTIKNSVFAGFLIRFRPIPKVIDKDFSKYYFRSHIPRIFFVKEMNLVTRASLSQELLKSLPVLLPSLQEQNKIAAFLDRKNHEFDKLATDIGNAVLKLKEYRQSLISEAVTGKIDVREWQPNKQQVE